MIEPVPANRKVIEIYIGVSVPNNISDTRGHRVTLLCDRSMSTADVLSLVVAAVEAATGVAREA